MWLAPLLLALGCLWQGLPGSARRKVAALTEPPTAVAGAIRRAYTEERLRFARKLLTRRIDEIRPGMRVLAEHPDAAENAKPDVDIHPPHWRMVSFVLAKPDGASVEVQSLRPAAWLRAQSAGVGDAVFLDLPEMGVQGAATVIEIADCPRIESGPGRIVTSTFRHTAGDVLDLSLSGSGQHPADRIGTTANHPFWSEDRQAFTPAGELAIGEHVRRADGSVTTIASLAARGERLTVFNLEVDAEHVYHVGVGGVLVHNTYHGNSALSTAANHGYVLFNRSTGKLLKFGISSQPISGAGASYRATSQVNRLRASGINADAVILGHFPDRAAALAWERSAVGSMRSYLVGGVPGSSHLPLQIRP